jgi:hypothetical protein
MDLRFWKNPQKLCKQIVEMVECERCWEDELGKGHE